MPKMFTVALIGPDGAGKSTIARRLEQTSPLPMKYMYMGVNLESSNMVLPTTRFLLELKRANGQRPDIAARPRDHNPTRPRPKSLVKRMAARLRTNLRYINLAAEEWYRQVLVWYYTWRGYSVILDRHFYFDYYAHDIANKNPSRPLNSRLHGYMLDKIYPKPDFVIFLDAPAEVFYARKPEGTLEACERRRQEYIELRDVVKSWAVVDVSQPVDKVVSDVSKLIVNFHQRKNGMDLVGEL